MSAIEWTDQIVLKRCSKCRKFTERCHFRTDRSRKDNLRYICNNCSYPNNFKISRKFRREMLSKGKKYCRKCKEWLNHLQIHGGLCQKHQNEAYNNYYMTTDFKFRKRESNHARKRDILPIPIWVKHFLLDLFNNLCAYCGKKKATCFDHIIPIKKGGDSTPHNIAPSCGSCNGSKQDKDVYDWLTKKNYLISDKLEELLIRSMMIYG